jgi:methylaspartate ammonia-lyase
MTPETIDNQRAKSNTWGLTPHQCMTIRLVCQHGGTKRASHAEDLPLRTLEHHLLMSRKAMGMYGNDVRLFLFWDRWASKKSNNLSTKL